MRPHRVLMLLLVGAAAGCGHDGPPVADRGGRRRVSEGEVPEALR